MANITLVIKIPKELYRHIQWGPAAYGKDLEPREERELRYAVWSGEPLPEGCDIQRIVQKRVNVQKWIRTKCPNPNCDYELSTHHGDGYYSIEHKPNFCPNCGQALLWESEE